MPRSRKPKLLPQDKGKFPTQTFGGIKGATQYIYDVGAYSEDWHKKSLDHGRKGMWVLHFPVASHNLDAAWRAVEKGVEEGVFMEAGFSKSTPGDKEQVIIIPTYDYNDATDVRFVHDEIKRRGINQNALNKDNLQYFTEEKFDLYFPSNPTAAKYSSDNFPARVNDLSSQSELPPEVNDNLKKNKEEIDNIKQDVEFKEYDHETSTPVSLFINDLENYIAGRGLQEEKRKKSYIEGGFFDRVSTAMSELSEKVTGMTTEVKVEAAKRMKFALENPGKPVSFTHDELKALGNDKLGDVVKRNFNILPEQYLEAEKLDAQDLGKPRW